jgi:hypothetical protein
LSENELRGVEQQLDGLSLLRKLYLTANSLSVLNCSFETLVGLERYAVLLVLCLC